MANNDFWDNNFKAIKENCHKKFKTSIINILQSRKIGVTVFLQNLAKDKNYWRKTTNNAEEKCDISKNAPGQISQIHDATLQAIVMFSLKLNLRALFYEQQLFYNKATIIDKQGKERTLNGFVDLICLCPDNKLCIVDLKVIHNNSDKLKFIDATLKQKYELQLRLYAFMLYHTLDMSYAPKMYLLAIRPGTGEAKTWTFEITLDDLETIDKTTNIYPETFFLMTQTSSK